MKGITCTKCKKENTSVEEIMTGVTVASEVTEVNDGFHEKSDEVIIYWTPYAEYGSQINEGGEVDRYQCGNCGETLAETIDELSEKMERKEQGELDQAHVTGSIIVDRQGIFTSKQEPEHAAGS